MSVELSTFSGALILSFCLILFMYVPGIRIGLNLADEGYLWHGTLRVLQGEVPIRDFRAYDPGRYYWCGLWMRLLGRNLLSLRICLVASQVLGLAAGVSAVHIASGDWIAAILAGLAIAPWMHPRHKQIDFMFAMLAVLIAVMLVDNSTPSQYLLSGVFVGLSFFFGLNHGLYAGGSCLLLVLILAACGQGLSYTVSLVWYALGVSCGMLPMLVMLLAVPGFARVYWQQKITRVLKRGTANLPLPIPWLWRSRPAQLKHLNEWTGFIVSVVYTAMPLLFFVVFLTLALRYEQVAQQDLWTVAVSSVGVFYMHHAMSRADLSHLAQAIPPFIIALIVCLMAIPFGWVGVVGVVIVSIWFIYLKQGPFGTESTNMEKSELGGTTLWLTRAMGNYVCSMRDLIDNYTKPGDPVLIVPTLVTLYPLMDRKPAAYDIFCVYPAKDDEQLRMISQLESANMSFALINNATLDGRDELRFSNTHNLVWDYLRREYQALDIGEHLPSSHHAFVRRTEETNGPTHGLAVESPGSS